MNKMKHDPAKNTDAHGRLEQAYKSEKPRLLARVRAAGRSLEEAEDLVHDVYAETMERLPLVADIRNLPAWINSLFTRRLIDAWRTPSTTPYASCLRPSAGWWKPRCSAA
jgi:DNA-directed RNA polymerase specialized sigma24 family protein